MIVNSIPRIPGSNRRSGASDALTGAGAVRFEVPQLLVQQRRLRLRVVDEPDVPFELHRRVIGRRHADAGSPAVFQSARTYV